MKILIVTKNWLGDVIFQIPAIEAVRSNYPDAQIICLTPARCLPILEAHPAVNRVILFDERREHRNWFSRLRFAFQLRREGYDKAFLFHRSRTRAFLLFLAGVKERIGFCTKGSWFLTQAVCELNKRMHHVDYFLELLRQAGLRAPEKGMYHFCFPSKDSVSASALLEKYSLKEFVCFHLGANWEPKRWPVAHFAKLADEIFDRWRLPIVLTGSQNDIPLATAMTREVRQAPVISLVGQTQLGELAAIFKQAQLVVSGDSGPMHLASGVGAKAVALFGPTDPNLTGPRGPGETILLQHVPPGYTVPWYGKDLPRGGWLSQIEPEEVLEAIEKKNWLESARTTPQAALFTQESSSRFIRHSKSNDDRHCEEPRRGDVAISEGKNEIASPVARNDNTKKPVSILFITLSNNGDVILTTPVISALSSQFPHLRLTVVVGRRAKGVLEGSRLIHRLVVYDKEAGLGHKFKFLSELRRERYDYVVDLKNSAVPFLVSTRKRSPVIRFFKETMPRQRYLEVLKIMGLETSGESHFDFFSETDEASLLEKLKANGIFAEQGWILVAPLAASELKTWTLSGFAEVIQRLLKERQEDMLLLGAKRERPLVEPLVRLNPSRVYNLADQLTFRELAALISRCSLLLSNDSSPMHLGCELKASVVAIFGPTNAEHFKREGNLFKVVREPVPCSPCERPVCRFKRQACFEDLSPDKVFRACKEMLDSKAVVSS